MRIATVLAHPDDAEIWAGGTLLKHSLKGDEIANLTFADQTGPRAAEALAGSRILNTNCQIADRSVLFSVEQLNQTITSFINSFSPDIIITHWGDDTHHQHRRVFHEVNAAVAQTRITTGFPKILFSCDTYNSIGISGPFNPSYYIDVTETFQSKIKAIRAHKSQPIKRWIKMAKTLGALHGGRCDCPYAEAFIEVPILGSLWACRSLPEVIDNT